MSEKLYLPVSILLSALVLSGTLFLVGGTISDQLATGLVIAGDISGDQEEGSGEILRTAPTQPTQPTQPTGGSVDMDALIEGAHLAYGNPNAKIKIVEFSDFECPFCGRAFPTVESIAEKYGDDIAIYFKHFPLSFHQNARPAALASECAADQGKFTEYHDVLFENQQTLGASNLKQFAVDLGLDAGQFNECFDSAKYSKRVDDDFAAGTQSGVSGTPTFFINGQKLVGAQPAANFESVIDQLLG